MISAIDLIKNDIDTLRKCQRFVGYCEAGFWTAMTTDEMRRYHDLFCKFVDLYQAIDEVIAFAQFVVFEDSKDE